MALITRLSRIFQADFHGVLDRIEEPDLQLKQALREMQFALERDKQALTLLKDELIQLAISSEQIQSSLKQYDDELDICLAVEEDDLARDLVRRKLVADKQLSKLEQTINKVAEKIERLAERIDKQTQQFTSMQQKLELLVSEKTMNCESVQQFDDSIRNEEIEIALLNEKQKRDKS